MKRKASDSRIAKKGRLAAALFFILAALLPSARAQVGPPIIAVDPTNQTVLTGYTATFGVSAVGSPPLSYQWYWNGAILPPASIPSAASDSLVITNVNPSLAGYYSVIVANPYGQSQSTRALLTVLTDPSIAAPPTNQTALAGQNVTFSVVAAGTFPFAYQWFFNGAPLQDSTTDALLLTNITVANGGFYAVALTNVFGSVTSAPATLSVLLDLARIKSFTNSVDGSTPFAPLIEGSDGLLYGTTVNGGPAAQGTIFRLAKNGGSFSVLHNFTSASTDGRQSDGILVEGTDGALYGTTIYGGSADHGTVFTIHKDGSGFSILHSFGATSSDASQPDAGLIQGSDGALYGTTYIGGTNGFGAVFKLDPAGTGYRVLHSFYDGSDLGNLNEGANPGATVTEGSDGALYGTTSSGGPGGGTVFKLNKDGTSFHILYGFARGLAGDTDGNPEAPLIEGSDGTLYGTTYGVTVYGLGNAEVFKLNKDGTGFTVLRTFSPSGGDAAKLSGALVEGPDGVLYGTAEQGGSFGEGAVFKLNRDGTGYSLVYSFTGSAGGGAKPDAALLLASDGAFYTTTSAGGDDGSGTIYRIKTALSGTRVSLAVNAQGGNLILSWQQTGDSYVLEVTPALAPAQWTQSSAPITAQGSTWQILLPAEQTSHSQFFRLRKL